MHTSILYISDVTHSHTCKWKNNDLGGCSGRGQHLALGWPLALEATVQARAEAGHKALPYHAQALAFVTPSSSVP